METYLSCHEVVATGRVSLPKQFSLPVIRSMLCRQEHFASSWYQNLEANVLPKEAATRAREESHLGRCMTVIE